MVPRRTTAAPAAVKCVNCGAEYPGDFFKDWGTAAAPETIGYGPDPKCVALVDDPRHVASQMVCGGQLAIVYPA